MTWAESFRRRERVRHSPDEPSRGGSGRWNKRRRVRVVGRTSIEFSGDWQQRERLSPQPIPAA
jgi:hypothetical protein